MNRIESNRPQPAAPPTVASPKQPAAASGPAQKDAAPASKDQFVTGKPGQAKEPQGDPLVDFSEIRQRRSARADGVKQAPTKEPKDDSVKQAPTKAPKSGGVKEVPPKELTREQMLDKARATILSSFEKDFVPTPEFQDTFGGQKWPELKDRIQADAKVFGTVPDDESVKEADGGMTFVGRIYGLYTEVTVHPDGKVDKPYLEID